jgi:hypothetical protein
LVPAVKNIPGQRRWGLITLINAKLMGGSRTHPAITNLGGEIYLRNLSTSGYRSAINQAGTEIAGPNLREYTSQTVSPLFPSTAQPQRLPILPTPEVPWDTLGNWVSVTSFGAKPDDNGDDTDGIQAAIDSGKTTVYFPKGTYKISRTISVRGKVRRVLGLWSIIDISDPLKSSTNPVWRFEKNQQPTVVFERFQSAYLSGAVNCTAIEHASPSTVVIRNSGLGGKAYRNQTGAGRLFIEDVSGAPWQFERQQVWARQLNPEFVGTKIINRGGEIWILGLKTEEIGTAIATESGGKTEVWGGLLYPIDNVPKDQPAFSVNQSKLSLSIGEAAYSPTSRYPAIVSETRNNVTRILDGSKLPKRTSHGRMIPLFTSG